MDAVLATILETEKVTAPTGETLVLHSHVTGEQGRLMQEIVRRLDAEVTLEVGLAFGVSALFICEALKRTERARHIVIDPYQYDARWRGIGMKNLHDAGYDDIIDHRKLPSHLALPQLEMEGVRLDFALIDGWHTFDYALVDFFHIDQMLRVGGVVVFDDAQWPGIHKVCRYVATNRRYRVLHSLGPGRPLRFPAARRVLKAAAAHSGAVSRLLRAELAVPDVDLSIPPACRCVAFEKIGEDDRGCFDHREF
jgi:predicted O-methyltransferase YrrM